MKRCPYLKFFHLLFIAIFILIGCVSKKAIQSPEEEFFHPIFSKVEQIDPKLLLDVEETNMTIMEEMSDPEGALSREDHALLDNPNNYSQQIILENSIGNIRDFTSTGAGNGD